MAFLFTDAETEIMKRCTRVQCIVLDNDMDFNERKREAELLIRCLEKYLDSKNPSLHHNVDI